MQRRLPVTRSMQPARNGFLSAILTHIPGAWFNPKNDELVALYSLRYKMALEERKYDIALIFLNKILEVDPGNVEAKLCKADLYYRHIRNYGLAIEQYNKVIRLTSDRPGDASCERARNSLAEIMELLS
jgi:tetratricopeptide (TPR) repeat protein